MLNSFTLFALILLVPTTYAQYYDYGNNSGWRTSYSAGVVIAVIAALLLLLSCCLITRRRRRFSQTVNPNVKPPLFGSAPPGYSLPFWNNDRFNQSTPAQNNTNDYTGGNGGPSTAGGYQYPPRTASNPPPPPYGTDTKGPYSPPVGPPPQAHTTGEDNRFVGGFRQ